MVPPRAWPERLRLRHTAPVGVVDTRPFLRRYSQWVEWERRRDAVTGRLLARRGAEGEAVAQDGDGVVWQTLLPTPVQHVPASSEPVTPIPGPGGLNVIESPPAAVVPSEPERTYRIKRAPLGPGSAELPHATHGSPAVTAHRAGGKISAVQRIGIPGRRVATQSGQDSNAMRHDRALALRDTPEQEQRASRLAVIHADRGETEKNDAVSVLAKRRREDEQRPAVGQSTTTQAPLGEMPPLAEGARLAAPPGPPLVIWRKPRADAAPEPDVPGVRQPNTPSHASSHAASVRADSPVHAIAPTAQTDVDAPKRDSAIPAHPAARLKDVDFQQLVERVSRQILRKISMDVERRGGRSWP